MRRSMLACLPAGSLILMSALVPLEASRAAAVADAGGYSYRTCLDPGGPTSAFIDISASGTPLGLGDDAEANITLPFAFPFYGNTSTSLRIGNNGGLLVGTGSGDVFTTNTALPANLGAAVLPFWDDLDSDTGNVFWQALTPCPNPDGGVDTACTIVQWHDRPHYSNSAGHATFQALLYANGNIVFHYLDVDFGNAAWNFGASATIGIQGGDPDPAHRLFTQVAFNQTPAVAAGCPIAFSFARIELDATATPDTNGTPGDECGMSGFIAVAAGTEVEICYEITNRGSVALSRHTLVDSVLGTLLNDFPYTLAPGASAFLTSNVIIAEPTIHTGTWTASNPGPVDVAVAEATAYVDVLGSGGFPLFGDGFEDPPSMPRARRGALPIR